MRNTLFTQPTLATTLTLPSKEDVSASHSRILILDSRGHSRLSEMLQTFGFEIDVLPNGAQTLEYLARAKGIIGVLLDIQPLVPGSMTVLFQLRDRYSQIPVITMSSVSHLDLLRRSIELGASEYLVVPTDPELLKRKCATVFYHRNHIAFMNNQRSVK